MCQSQKANKRQQRRRYNRRTTSQAFTPLRVVLIGLSLFGASWWLAGSTQASLSNSPAIPSTLSTLSLSNPAPSLKHPQEIAINPEPVEDVVIPEPTWRHIAIAEGDTLSAIFAREKLAKMDLFQVLSLAEIRQSLKYLNVGQTLSLEIQQDRLLQLKLPIDLSKTLHIQKVENNFIGKVKEIPLENHWIYAHTCVESSLYIDALQAGLSGKHIVRLEKLFRKQFNLKKLRKGDHFSVIYQEQRRNATQREVGDLVAAMFSHRGKTYHAVLGNNGSGKPAYYQADNVTLQKLKLLSNRLNHDCQPQPKMVELPTQSQQWTLAPYQHSLQLFDSKDDSFDWLKTDRSKPVYPPAKPKPQVAKRHQPKRKHTAKPLNLPDVDDEQVATILDVAQQMMGIPYRYGGTTPKNGFDCSGLVMYSLNKAGIKIPRTARAQYAATAAVKKGDLQPGDLVFFRINHRYIDHVGIYIGDGKFIHAPSKNKTVRIANLNGSYYRKYFVRGGRYAS